MTGVQWQAGDYYADPNNPAQLVRDVSAYVDAAGSSSGALVAEEPSGTLDGENVDFHIEWEGTFFLTCNGLVLAENVASPAVDHDYAVAAGDPSGQDLTLEWAPESDDYLQAWHIE